MVCVRADMGTWSWIRGSLIGTGAFGKVNLAMNREDGEVFAVKSVQVDASDAGAKVSLDAIENEIEILQSLDSKFVVRCLGSDWSEESGKVMRNVFLEYMPEGCLTDFVKQFAGAEPLGEHLIRTYTRSIVQGIHYLHSNGIVHCDIKGKNILVGNGNVKLTDFGSAKRVGSRLVNEVDDEVLNCFAKVNGTPLWMAPEVVRQVEQGPASDIWSLGCTVVEMATGKAPWSNLANPFVALYHIGCTDEIPAVPASLSPEAHDFLAQCFQRDPRKRWTSAQLLEHPFLTSRYMAIERKPISTQDAPLSPTSVMQSPASDSSSGFSSTYKNSVPILSTPSFFRRRSACERPSERSSAKTEVQGLDNWWGNSPLSQTAEQWIVVRSPKGSSPSASFPFSDLMAPVVEVPIPARNPEDPVSSGAAAVGCVYESSTRSSTPGECSYPGAASVRKNLAMLFAPSGVCAKVFSVDVNTEILNREGEMDVDVRSLKRDESGVLLGVEEPSLSAEAGSSFSWPWLMSVMEDEAPCTSDGLKSCDRIHSVSGVSQLESCLLGSKQETLFLCRRLLGAQRGKLAQFTRNQLQQSTVDYVCRNIGPLDRCTSLSRNEHSPMVKLRINSCRLCVWIVFVYGFACLRM